MTPGQWHLLVRVLIFLVADKLHLVTGINEGAGVIGTTIKGTELLQDLIDEDS
jgi:hypothetical protein